MFCPECGAEIKNEEAVICIKCGIALPPKEGKPPFGERPRIDYGQPPFCPPPYGNIHNRPLYGNSYDRPPYGHPCGRPFYPTPNERPRARQEINIYCLLGFIFAFLSCIAGLVLSIIGYTKVKNTPDSRSRGFAKAGIIISAILLGISLISGIFSSLSNLCYNILSLFI